MLHHFHTPLPVRSRTFQGRPFDHFIIIYSRSVPAKHVSSRITCFCRGQATARVLGKMCIDKASDCPVLHCILSALNHGTYMYRRRGVAGIKLF